MKIFRITAIILLISCMILIFGFSAQTATESSKTSGDFITSFVKIFYSKFNNLNDLQQEDIIEYFQFFVRKSAHFSIYMVLGFLAFLSVVTYKNIPYKLRIIISLLICFLYSVSDEIHQTFIPGRSGEIRDVFIDFCGSLLAIFVLNLISKSKKFIKFI